MGRGRRAAAFRCAAYGWYPVSGWLLRASSLLIVEGERPSATAMDRRDAPDACRSRMLSRSCRDRKRASIGFSSTASSEDGVVLAPSVAVVMVLTPDV